MHKINNEFSYDYVKLKADYYYPKYFKDYYTYDEFLNELYIIIFNINAKHKLTSLSVSQKIFRLLELLKREQEIKKENVLNTNIDTIPCIVDTINDFIEYDDYKYLINTIKTFLTPKEYEVIEQRYFEGRTLDEIADNYTKTRERVRQIENTAIRKIKHKLEYKGYKIVSNPTHKHRIYNRNMGRWPSG